MARASARRPRLLPLLLLGASSLIAALVPARPRPGPRRPAATYLDDLESKKDAPAAGAAASGEKSALVFGFFAAKDRELAFIERQYRRNGFDDVVVVPSLVARVARPSGWYRIFRENARLGRDHHLARHFDVVHCMSGGFLQCYLTRGAGVPLTCDTLLLDSTPILPKPSAFTQFARQFVRDAGLGPLVGLFPRLLHLTLVRLRWSLTAVRLRLQHRLARATGRHAVENPYRDLVTSWLRMSSAAAMAAGVDGSYDRLSEHCEKVLFGRAPAAGAPKRALFLHNPADPYLSSADVLATLDHARALGCETHVKEVATAHIQTIFQKPKLLFDALPA